MKKTIVLGILSFLLITACEKETETTPDFQPQMEWQSDYAFDKTTSHAVNFPEPVGNEIVVGDGTPQSVTRATLQKALDQGGHITLSTGGQPVVVYVDSTLVVKRHGTFLDGGGLLTLDARGERRILYSVGAHHILNPRFAEEQVKELTWHLKGIHFVNGKTTGGTLDEAGPNPDNNDGSGNSGQAGSGGAVWSGLWNQLYVQECTFVGNETRQLTNAEEVGGGALYARGGNNSKLVVVDCYFKSNKGGIGGAINNLLTNLELVRCGFFENESSNTGGAVYTDGAASDGGPNLQGTINLHACIFKDNAGARQGGGAFLFVYDSQIKVEECLFEANHCRQFNGEQGLGGGLRTGNGISVVSKCAFVSNRAEAQGGGLWIGENNDQKATITNCTFYQNIAQEGETTNTGLGGAIMGGAGPVWLTNNTIANNTAAQGAGLFGGANFRLQNNVLSDNVATNPWGQNYNVYKDMSFEIVGGNLQWVTNNTDSDVRNALPNVTAEDPLFSSELDRESGFTPVLGAQSASPLRSLGIQEDAPSQDQINQNRGASNDCGALKL